MRPFDRRSSFGDHSSLRALVAHAVLPFAVFAFAIFGLLSCVDDGAGDDCEPDCAGRCCGPDGCGGVCADTCADTQELCDENSCLCSGACVPDCIGRCCGPNGCGGTCPDMCADSSGFCDVSVCTCTSVCDYQLNPTTPFRRLDTRSDEKLQAGSEHSFVLAGRDGIPDTAQAVVLRFTVVAPEAPGHITAYDTGAAAPDASVLNYADSQTTGNTVVVKVGTENKITVRTSATTHLIIDVFGYTVEPAAFHSQTPFRLLDTQSGATPGANSTTCVTVAGANGVADDAKAVAVVVTATSPEAAGSMVAFASGTAPPLTQSLSFEASQTTANGTIVQIGADKQICVHTTAPSHFIVDVTGYFEMNAAYQPLPPFRKLDMTHDSGTTHCYQLAGVDGIPSDAQAIAFNLTTVAPTEQGYITAYADGTQRPVSSNLNYPVGGITTNGVISKIGDNGNVCFYQHGSSRLLVDVVGYWPPMDSCCTGVTCESPPFIGCSGTTDLITYAASGTCHKGTCDYAHSVTACGYLCQQDACIAAPSFPFHDRTSWQDPAYPVTSSSWMDLNALSYITLHYIGADGVDLSDIPQFLRNAQLDYVINRGYSLGYNSAVSLDGDEWEIRGFDYRCAANGEQATNIPAYSILLMLPNTWSVPPTTQIDGVRNLVSKIRATAAAAGNSDFLEINGHRDLKSTACPGDAIYTMIQNGSFEP